MNHAHVNKVEAAAGAKLGIIAPDGRQGMLDHAAQFAAAGIPYMFDPGQGLPMFNGEELRGLVSRAAWVAVNDYEASLLTERCGWSAEQIAAQVKALVITRGGDGSWIYADGQRHEIPAAHAAQLADPTGCGDAYRAGLLYGLQRGLDWPTTGRIAALAGTIKIEHHGTQHHRYDWPQFAARFHQEFGFTP
jgi:adenosine kinase